MLTGPIKNIVPNKNSSTALRSPAIRVFSSSFLNVGGAKNRFSIDYSTFRYSQIG